MFAQIFDLFSIVFFPLAPKLIRKKLPKIDGALKLILAKINTRQNTQNTKLIHAKINTNKVFDFNRHRWNLVSTFLCVSQNAEPNK